MNHKPKCTDCGSDLQIAERGYIRRAIKHDGTAGYMISGESDNTDNFLICSHVKCNARYELRRISNGKIIRGNRVG
ncbi:hypothetical protein [Cytobacillus praedii]|uniref:hypothetical protein n=1 Tax=Cytobacillus praedii TaxID=1742358 RepID=UPI002E1F8F2B|nr:hypothetical protein [Cytobacillus praedii]